MQVIYDLLVKNSSPLELREDPDLGVQVAGLRHINVGSAGDILVSKKGWGPNQRHFVLSLRATSMLVHMRTWL